MSRKRNSMETVKQTKDYSIYKKRNSRYGIKDARKNWINGEEKVKILADEGLITIKKAKEKPAAEENSGEEASKED